MNTYEEYINTIIDQQNKHGSSSAANLSKTYRQNIAIELIQLGEKASRIGIPFHTFHSWIEKSLAHHIGIREYLGMKINEFING